MWSLKGSHDQDIAPLIYSNGKTQYDVVKEILQALESYDVVNVKGAVGTGKSAIALGTIANLGSGIVVVPTKILEHQYTEAYCSGKQYHLLDKDGNKLDVKYMFGKGNYNCRYMDNKVSAINSKVPCSRKLKEGEKRIDVASKCKYWSPIYAKFMAEHAEGRFSHHEQIKYLAVGGEKYFFMAEEPCEYYKQFFEYTHDCAIIMNQAKWSIETWIGRKPVVPVEIIDEGDAFLDGLAYKTIISAKLFKSLKREKLVELKKIESVENSFHELCLKNPDFDDRLNAEIQGFLQEFIETFGGASTSGIVCDLCNKIKLVLQYNLVSWAKLEKEVLTIFIPRPDLTFNEIKKRSGKIIIMSATVHNEKTLSNVFGITSPIVEAEPRFCGTMYMMFTGKEVEVTHENWQNPSFQYKYFGLLESIIAQAKRPTLIQVHAKKYIPLQYQSYLNKGFINGVSWSTVTDRGVDLPDDKCLLPDTMIVCKDGIKEIKDINIGDMVLTHNGRFQRVSKVFINPGSSILKVRNNLCNLEVGLSPEHPIYSTNVQRCKISGNRRGYVCRSNCGKEGYVNKTSTASKFVLESAEPDYFVTVHKNGQKPWSKEDVRKLIDFYRINSTSYKKISCEEIGKVLGRTARSIRIKAKRIGLKQIKLRECTKAYKNYTNNWKEIGKLDKNDYCVYPIIKETMDIEEICFGDETINFRKKNRISLIVNLNEKFMRLIGYYLAEGCVQGHQISFTFNENEGLYIHDVHDLIKDIFGLESKISYNKKYHIGIVCLDSTTLAKWFAKQYGWNSYSKKIPNDYLFLPVEKQAQLVIGAFRGDGGVNGEGYSSASIDLIVSLRMILMRMGIKSSLNICHKYYDILGNRIDAGTHRLHIIDIEKMRIILGLKEKGWRKSTRRTFMNDNYLFTNVEEVRKEDYTGMLYNLEVENDNSYCTVNMCLHNCRSIVITKFPLPDTSDIVYRTMEKMLGSGRFWAYMNDIAERELVQQCGRAIRHPLDYCQLWSPDSRVMSRLARLWKGKKVMEVLKSQQKL